MTGRRRCDMVVRMRSPSRPTSTFGVLTALAVALVPAFVYAPRPLAAAVSGHDYGSQGDLTDSFSETFVGYWNSGDRRYTPDLARVVDYWSAYHVVKAVAAALLLGVLVALGILLRKAFPRTTGQRTAGKGRRTAVASARAVVTALALFSVVLLMANVQGAIAPFSSLLSLLDHPPHGALADAVHDIRRRLADYPETGAGTPPALRVMVDDFARYHVVIAGAATTVVAVLVALSVVAWKRFVRTDASDRRARRLFRSFGLGWAVVAVPFVVIAVANVTVTADPAPALLAFFEGGW